MALGNGVLVHSADSWACAIRLPDGELKVASREEALPLGGRHQPAAARPGAPRRGLRAAAGAQAPPAGGRAALRQSPGVLASMAGATVAVKAVRESPRLKPAAQELVSGLLALAPALMSLRNSDVAAYHGAEHISIGSYEHGETRARRSTSDAAAHLVGPLLAHDRNRQRARRQGAARTCAGRARHGSLGAIAASMEIFGWMVEEPAQSARPCAREAGPRAAAPARRRPSRRPSSSRSPRRRSPPAWSSSSGMSLQTERGRRLPPEIFDLPVEKMRDGYYTDAYFNHARSTLLADGRRPRVVMQVFQKKHAYLGGMDEAIAVLKLCSHDWDALTVHALHDGDEIEPWETVHDHRGRLHALRPPRDGLPRRPRPAHADHDEHGRGARGGERQARHLHAGAPRPLEGADGRRVRGLRGRAGRRRADRRHDRRPGQLVGRQGRRHRAALADRRRTAATPCSRRRSSRSGRRRTRTSPCWSTSRTTRCETALAVARALGDRLWGVRLDTSESWSTARSGTSWATSGRPASTSGSSARCATRSTRDGFERVSIVVSGGFTVERIREFERNGVPVDAYGIGSSLIRGANDYTGDVVLTDGRPSGKAGRRFRPNPRLELVD